jgi:hypothetical protein
MERGCPRVRDKILRSAGVLTMILPGAPASRRPVVGTRKPELAGETSALPGMAPRFKGSNALPLPSAASGTGVSPIIANQDTTLFVCALPGPGLIFPHGGELGQTLSEPWTREAVQKQFHVRVAKIILETAERGCPSRSTFDKPTARGISRAHSAIRAAAGGTPALRSIAIIIHPSRATAATHEDTR